MKMTPIFDRSQLLDFFSKLDQELNEPVPLYVIGGAAATIAYESKTGTKDVDTWEREKRIEEAYKKVIKKFPHLSMPLGQAGVNIKSNDMKSRFKEFKFKKLKNLSILVPEPEDLFLLKAQRSDEKDLVDLQNLNSIEDLNINKILDRFKQDVLLLNYGNDEFLKFNYLRAIARVFGQKEAIKQEKLIF